MKKPTGCFDFTQQNLPYCRKEGQAELFSEAHPLRLCAERYVVQDKLNVLGVSKDLYARHMHEKMALIDRQTGKSVRVFLREASIPSGEFLASAYVQERLLADDTHEFFLCAYQNVTFRRVLPQKIAHIRESNLAVSKADYDRIMGLMGPLPFRLLEIYNSATDDSMIVQAGHLFADDSLKPGTLRLSRKQRICLGLELPLFLPEAHWNALQGTLNEEEQALMADLYGSADHTLNPAVSYGQKQAAKKLLEKQFPPEIHMVPVLDSLEKKPLQLARKLSNFYVGKSTIFLMARRPYDIDEGLDIVRMTDPNMKLLGIDEMDKITLQYENRSVSCRVLGLHDKEAFSETNRPVPLDLAVGIPAHIRKKLGVMDQSTTVKIDRDTGFLFKKSLNEQVVPILLTLFSTNLFANFSVWVTVLLSIVAVPLVLYLNLSSKRSMRT